MATPETRTVLLADDDASVLAMLEQTFVRHGWIVLSATDGQDALSRHGPDFQAIDLLVTDLHMPAMNGHELAEHVRRQRPDLPIIFISGDSGLLTPTNERFPGHVFIKKPFRPSDIVAHLLRWFPTD